MKGSVRKRGSTWSYYFDLGVFDGKRKRKEKGGFRTKAEAESSLRKAMKEYEEEGQIFTASNISVSEYFDYWYTTDIKVNCKFNTQEYYRRIINNHIKTYFKDVLLKQLSPAMLQEFLNSKMINGFSKSSVSAFSAVLSKALRYAVYPLGYIKENPMNYVRLPKYNEKPKNTDDLKIITLEQFDKIVERFPEKSNFFIPLQIGFNTGMRVGEVCALQWDNIDLDNKTITVEHTLISKGKGIHELTSPKTKSSYRTIRIGDSLVKILKRHQIWQKKNKLEYGRYYRSSDFVCTKENGENITTDSIKYLCRIVNYELMINFNFHSLRHTHATMLLEAGANPKDIQKRLGHSKISTTLDTYSHVTKKIESETVDIIENIICHQAK